MTRRFVFGSRGSDSAPQQNSLVLLSKVTPISPSVSNSHAQSNNSQNHQSGTDGPDVLIGTDGNDHLEGLAGDDQLFGGLGRDHLEGGAGNDELAGGDRNDILEGGVGDDILMGDIGNDSLQGGAGADVLFGGLGNDSLQGGADDDLLFGGLNSDSLEGGAGDDELIGGRGSDSLDGGAGDDLLDGGRGGDSLKGGAGNDVLDGGHGKDSLEGGTGDDILMGGRGKDSLDGGAGDDVLSGGSGIDRFIFKMDAIGGSDRILDFVAGKQGDVIDLRGLLEGANFTNVAVYLQAELIDGDTIITVDVNGDGSGFDDLTIILEGFEIDSVEQLVRDGNLQLPVATSFWSAGDGDSQMNGGADFDMLVVDLANNSDQVLVTPMADGRISIVVGTETLIADGFEELSFTGTEGDDHITISGDFSATDLAPNTIFISGLGGNDFFDASLVSSLHRTITSGSSGDDILGGGAGNDILDGEAGDDYISARGGDDVLIGGLGNDSLIGGAGNDTADYSSYLQGSSERILTSLVSGTTTETTSNGIFTDALVGIENVIGAAGDDLIVGNGEDNRIDGAAGDDFILGNAGNDVLIGGAGDDFLNGGSGRDTLDYSTAGGSTARVLVDLSLNIAYELNSVGVIAGTDTLVSIENAIGSSGHDEFYGTNQQNTLSGLAGDDIFHASASSDTIIGGTGFDVLRINGSYNDYQIVGDDSVATVTSSNGIDSLQGIEKIEFSTGGVSEFYLDGTGNLALPPQLTGFSTDIAENLPGQIIGQVTATDPNNDAVSFAIAEGPNSSLFAVDSLTGELSTTGPLDFEQQPSYFVTVTGSDPSGLSNTTTVVVNVLDVDEAPVVQAGNIVALGVDAGAVPLRIAAPFDPEGNTVSIRVGEIPHNGSILLLDGSTVARGDELTVEQLTQLKFLPAGSNPTDAGGFAYRVIDDVSGLNTDSRVALSVVEPLSVKSGVKLMGADGDDVLYGSQFSDEMIGGEGADTFVIAVNDSGDNIIADFNSAQGDQLDFSALYPTLDLNNLAQHFQLAYDGSNTTLTIDAAADGSVDSSITFKNVDLTSGTQDPNVDEFSSGEVVEQLQPTSSPIISTGIIRFTDADIFDTHEVTAVTPEEGARGELRAQVETDSTFTGEPGAIVWTYQLAPFLAEYLAAGETRVDRFTVVLADSSGGEVKTTVAIEITGSNDQPIVTGGDVSADVTEALFAFGVFDDNSSDDLSSFIPGQNSNNTISPNALQIQTILSDSGSIEFHDIDRADSHEVSNIEASAGALGELKAEVSTDTAGTDGSNGLVDWTYKVAGTDVEYLAQGETITESFLVTIDDDHGGSVQSSVDVTITGTNDIPFLRGGDLNGVIQRTAAMNAGDIISESGFVKFTDADLSDTHTVSVSRLSLDQWGSLTAEIVHESGGGDRGVITWQYDVDAAHFDKLASGQIKTDQFEITIDDGHGRVTSKIVEVSIDGGELIRDSNAYSVSFEALNQSLWGEGTSGDDLIKSDFWGIDTPTLGWGLNVDAFAFELQAWFTLKLKAGLESTLQLDDGSLNANISYDISVDSTIDPANDTISFDTSAFLLSGGGFSTDLQGGSYNANFVFESEGSISATVDPVGLDSFTLLNPDFFNLSVSTHEPSLSSVLGVDEITVDQILTTSQENTNSSSSVNYQSSATSGNFLEREFDLDAIIFGAETPFGSISPFGTSIDLGIANVEGNLIDVTLKTGANLTQDFALSLDGLGGMIHFTESTGLFNPDIEFTFGETFTARVDATDLDGDGNGRIDYEIVLDPNAHFFNDTNVGLDVSASIDILKLVLGYDFYVKSGTYTLGPAASFNRFFDVAEWDLLDRDFDVNFLNQTLSGLSTSAAITNASPDARFTFLEADELGAAQSLGFVQASDADLDVLSYQIIAGNDDGLFTIDAASGEVFSTQALNFDAQSQHGLRFRVTDTHGASDSALLTVFVNDINRAPVSVPDIALTIADEMVVIDVSANDSDPDDDDDESTLTYEFVGQIGSGQIVNNNDGTFTFDPNGDFDQLQAGESLQSFFSYQARDSHGLAGNTTAVVVTINGVAPPNTAPVPSYSGTPTAAEAQSKLLVTTVSPGDSDAGDSWSYAIIAGNVAGLFSINAAGNISTTGALDFESVNHYDLEVRVTDSGGLSGTVVVPVSVTNVDEGVNATGFTVSIDENSQGSLGTVDASDPDLGSIKFAISGGNDSAAFAIDELTGEITVISDLNHEQDAQHSLTVAVTDSAGETTDATVVVNVDDVNEQPLLSYAQTTFNVEENLTAVEIAAPSAFSDVDSGDVLTFDIAAGNDSGLFSIDASTGVLSTTGPLDFEDVSRFRLELRVTDSGGLSSSANVTINVDDVIEKDPTLEAFESRYYYHTSEHSIVAGMSVTNPLDGTDVFPTVRVDGTFAGVNYAASAASNGIASFLDPSEPTYNFEIDPAFELADSTGSFTYMAELGVASASAQVDVRSYTTGDNNFTGGDGNDVLLGSAGRNVLNGGGGDDILFGYGGNDIITAGDGDNIIDAGSGEDDVIFHRLTTDSGSNVVIGGDGSRDQFYITNAESNDVTIDASVASDNSIELAVLGETQILREIEILNISDERNVSWTVTGDFTASDLFAIRVNGVKDIDASAVVGIGIEVTGSEASDRFLGGSGNDFFLISETGGTVTANGGAGSDTASVQMHNTADVLVDVVAGASDGLLHVALDGHASTFTDFDILSIHDFAFGLPRTGEFTVRFSGDFSTALDDDYSVIHGLDATVNFDASAVTSDTKFLVSGSSAADELSGGAGADLLRGQVGDDRIEGGLGADNLTGGGGSDRFVFGANVFAQTLSDASQKDTITDYAADEVIELADVFEYIETDLNGNVTSVENVVAPGASDGALQVNYNTASGAHSVVLADLLNYTATITYRDNNPVVLTAHNSAYYYSTTAGHSLESGISLVGPMGLPYFPTVRVDGGGSQFSVTSSTSGLAGFADSSSPAYGFSVDAAFEDTDNGAFFEYLASDVGVSASGTVGIMVSTTAIDLSWFGGSGNDVFVGGLNRIDVRAGAGDDFILGSASTDFLRGEAGSDILLGGAGNDFLSYDVNDGLGDDFFDGGEGTDFVDYTTSLNDETDIEIYAEGDLVKIDSLAGAAVGSTQSIANVEHLVFQDGGSLLDANYRLEGNLLTSLSSISILGGTGALLVDASAVSAAGNHAILVWGGFDDDVYQGGDAPETFLAHNGGQDTFNAAAGNDVLSYDTSAGIAMVNGDGGDGSDRALVHAYRDDVITVSSGVDANDGVTLTINGVTSNLTNFESLGFAVDHSGLSGSVNITVSGDFAGDQPFTNLFHSTTVDGTVHAINFDASLATSTNANLSGGDGDDTLIIVNGNLRGYGGNDVLIGGNFIDGGDGDDRLDGGAGDDILIGGNDSDVFVFSSNNFGEDRVLDFEDGFDLIDLSFTNLEFNDLVISQQGASTLIDAGDGNSIELLGVDASLITSDDFLI